MLSFWEREHLLQYDVIIIGAGIVGLQTAIQVKEKQPKYKVMVLERGLLPYGASTRNAGFAATGSLSELVEDCKTMSEYEVVNLFLKRKKGLDFLRNQLGDTNISYIAEGSHELLETHEVEVLDHLDRFNNLFKDKIESKLVFAQADERIASFGLNNTRFKYCIENTTEAALDSGKLMQSLYQYAIEKGVSVKTGATVDNIEEKSNRVEIRVVDASRNETINFSASQLFVCTNAFSKMFFPEEDIQPGRGQVLITHPIENLAIKGIYHFDQGYYYFRNVGNRVLFGGARNLDFETENTTDIALNTAIQNHLIKTLQNDLLPEVSFKIDMQWSGIMAFGKTKQPIVKSFSNRIHGGFRLGGIGVALGSMVALELVELMGDF